MTRKKLLLTATAAAVLAAFNPAFAGGGAKHGAAEDMSSPSAKTEQSTEQSLPTPEQSASSSSNDVNVSYAERNAESEGPIELGSSAGASSDAPQDEEKRSVDPDRLTGLDRAHPAN